MEIKCGIKAWITIAAAVLEALEVNLSFLFALQWQCEKVLLELLAVQQQQKKKTCWSYSTGNDLWKVKISLLLLARALAYKY